MSFLGDCSDWSQVPSWGWGYTSSRQGGYPRMGYSLARSGWSTPRPGQDGVLPGQDRMGYPPARTGVSPLARSELGIPLLGLEYPPGTGYAWISYATGSTPLAVSRRRTVLFPDKFMLFVLHELNSLTLSLQLISFSIVMVIITTATCPLA